MVKRKTTLDTKNPEFRLCVDYRDCWFTFIRILIFINFYILSHVTYLIYPLNHFAVIYRETSANNRQ
jgi:hypothetical protein